MEPSLQATELYKTALSTVERYKMVEHGDSIAVGVSGGADSVALLTFLCAIAPALSLTLTVCHLEHGLRGAESREDAEFVRRLAAKLGLAYRMEAFDTAREAAKAGQGIEEYARARRYAFFASCAGESGKIATAHTLDDAAETMLFHLARGTGVRGLRGIPRVRENIIRPLRDCSRHQVEAFLTAAKQDWRHDSTNDSDDYSRNYIRHHLLPTMKTLNPTLLAALGRTMAQMEQQWQMTEAMAAVALAKLATETDTLDRAGFLALPPPVAAALLGQWLGATEPTSNKLLEKMLAAAHGGAGTVTLAPNLRFAAGEQNLRLVREVPLEKLFFHELTLPQKPGQTVSCPTVPGKTLQITRVFHENTENTEKFYNKDFKNFMSCDKMEERVLVHPPGQEDTIRLQGREHRMFVRYRTGNHGLSAGEISRMAVVCCGGTVAWAERLGSSQTHTWPQGCREFYLFEVLEDKL